MAQPKNRQQITETTMLQPDSEQQVLLEKFLVRIDKLQSSPTVALRVMELTRQPEFEMHKVAESLALDPALSASVLRLVNSSHYGLVDRVTNLPQALTYLGRRSLRLAVLSFGLIKTMVNGSPAAFHENYWKRSLTMAAAARECAKLVGADKVDSDTAFTTGLIADLGMLAFAQLEEETYLEIAKEPDHTIDLVKRERETFGFDHMAVSRGLMERWELPVELIEAVGNHHTYMPISAHLNHVALVANLITEIIWTPVCPYMQPLLQVMARHLGLGIDELITLVMATKESIDECKDIFGVQLPEEIDAEVVERQAREMFESAAREMAGALDGIFAMSAIPIR